MKLLTDKQRAELLANGRAARQAQQNGTDIDPKPVFKLYIPDGYVSLRELEDEARKLPYPAKPDQIDWVIAGGESDGHARPTHPNWIGSLRDQCRDNGVPFHFKQWGHWSPERKSQKKPEGSSLKTNSVSQSS